MLKDICQNQTYFTCYTLDTLYFALRFILKMLLSKVKYNTSNRNLCNTPQLSRENEVKIDLTNVMVKDKAASFPLVLKTNMNATVSRLWLLRGILPKN